jgi:hypothetical protein
MVLISSTQVAAKLSIEFNKIAPYVEKAYIAVGLITHKKFDFGMRKLKDRKHIHVLCGVHMATPPTVMRALKELTDAGEISSGVYTKAYFHSKLYLFDTLQGWIAFVGSGNFTDGGWFQNEELFVRIVDQQTCLQLKDKFDQWVKDSKMIDDQFLEAYEQSFVKTERIEADKKKHIQELLDQLNSTFNIDIVDFSGQFFQEEDVMAFRTEINHLDTFAVLEERQKVRNKLYVLNDLLRNRIPPEWRIVPHYDTQHIVSHIYTKNHHDYRVNSLWLGYGRNKEMLKKYDESYDYRVKADNTPLHFMRMQIIVHYESVGVWLMPGKNAGGMVDRLHFREKMKDLKYAERFYQLLINLGECYEIDIADQTRVVSSFANVDDLKHFVAQDDWQNYYFNIRREYSLDDPAISRELIVDTCLGDFKKYWPIYQMILDMSYEQA